MKYSLKSIKFIRAMNFKCTLHGSYQKDLELIRLVAELFELIGVEVLCPTSFNVIKNESGFVLFENDHENPITIEDRLLNILRENVGNKHFFAYFVNKDGYVGSSASFELAIVRELGVQFYSLEQIAGLPVSLEDRHIVRPVDLARRLVFGVDKTK